MSSFFASDWHLGHSNIIKYDKRPFKSIEEMNETIITNHNKVVTYEDDWYFLGDFAFNKDKKIVEEWMNRIIGNKFFIRGNHDHSDTRKLYAKYGTYLGEQAEIQIEGQSIVLNHYAMRVWNKSHRGAWHLYGHSHHSLPEEPNSLSFDVGCNGWNYEPLSFERVKEKMSKKTWRAIDHHTGRHNQ